MRIGILGAMLEEVSSIKEMMSVESEISYGGRVYLTGKIGSHEIVLTFSRWGKVASSSTTTTLINKFDVELIIFTGVAGAVDKNLNIGDVIIGNGFYQHDMDARPLFEQFQIPLTDKILFKPNIDQLSIISFASKEFIKKIKSSIGSILLANHSILNPRVYHGIIASGDQFISNPENHATLNFNYEGQKTLAVEMEGAAVAQVCYEYEIPYLVVRTISDKADHSAAIDFQLFIKEIASKYSAGIIKEYLELINKNLYSTESKLALVDQE